MSGLAASPALYKSLPFDPVKDLAAVTQVAASTLLLVVTPKLPAATTQELIALAKAKPGSLNYGSSGVGAPLHLTMEIMKHATGIDIVHVPFRGDAPLNTALIAGDVQMAFIPTATGQPLTEAGRVRALGLIGLKRASALPDVPTLAESGVKGLESSSWYGVFAPAKTPTAIVDRLAREVSKAIQSPEVADRMRAQGNEPVGGTPEAFAALVQRRRGAVHAHCRDRRHSEAMRCIAWELRALNGGENRRPRGRPHDHGEGGRHERRGTCRCGCV